MTDKFYLSKPWRKIRRVKLKENPLCEYCLAVGKYTPATCVDHYTPIKKGGAKLDKGNLKSSCNKCHSSKTQGSDINGGLDVLRRGCDENGIPRLGWNTSVKTTL